MPQGRLSRFGGDPPGAPYFSGQRRIPRLPPRHITPWRWQRRTPPNGLYAARFSPFTRNPRYGGVSSFREETNLGGAGGGSTTREYHQGVPNGRSTAKHARQDLRSRPACRPATRSRVSAPVPGGRTGADRAHAPALGAA